MSDASKLHKSRKPDKFMFTLSLQAWAARGHSSPPHTLASPIDFQSGPMVTCATRLHVEAEKQDIPAGKKSEDNLQETGN